jgi:hypothetical protein
MNKEKRVFLNNIKGAKRKEIKELLIKIVESRQKQLLILEKLLSPLKDNICIGKETLKSNYTINDFQAHSKITKKYMDDLENFLEKK